MYQELICFLEHHLLACPSRQLLHMACPGCGLQRSIIALLRGELGTSLRLHPAAIPLVLLFLFLPFHLKFRFRKGASLIVGLQLCIAIITFGFYVYKIINNQIFI